MFLYRTYRPAKAGKYALAQDRLDPQMQETLSNVLYESPFAAVSKFGAVCLAPLS